MSSERSVMRDSSVLHDEGVSSGAYDCVQVGNLAAAFDRAATRLPTMLTEVRRRLHDIHPNIALECAWRRSVRGEDATAAMRVTASRWQALQNETREVEAETAGDMHLVKIVLRATKLALRIDGKIVHDGVATPGMVQVTEPGASARCLFRGPYDTLHLHVPNALIAECLQDMPVRPGPLLAMGPGLTPDPTTERLGRALLTASQTSGALGPLYADCVGIAIVAQLLLAVRSEGGARARGRNGLLKWRLMRSIDYIESHLDEPISLADMAAAADLTQMHFAAQFKVSTGLRPHEYLLRRRIERAQEMLLAADLSVVEIAHSVGFQTQSHFTTTFARFVGHTPHAWRLANGAKRSHR